MSRESVLILVGALVILSPFVGLPLQVLAWVLPVLGLVVVGIGIALRSRRRKELRARVAPPAEHLVP